jgi:hypothetical protein
MSRQWGQWFSAMFYDGQLTVLISSSVADVRGSSGLRCQRALAECLTQLNWTHSINVYRKAQTILTQWLWL